MMVVTDIKDYKKGRYEIFLNDEFAFVLYKSELKSNNISIGTSLDDEAISFINDNILKKRCIKRAMNLLIKGDLTEMKLRSKLADSKYSADIIDEAIKYVKSYHYIDDRRYAMNYIAYKSSTDSKNTIRRKLIEKGVAKDIIDSCIEEYYVDDELNRDTERKLIEQLVRKKCKDNSLPDNNMKQKLIASLMRKGFSYYDIEAVINDYFS